MSNRPSPLSLEQQADIGAVVAGLRAAGWCWKRIEDWLDMERTQLWRCLRRWEMQQNNPGMQHQGAGKAA